jgi:hypothetical protein
MAPAETMEIKWGLVARAAPMGRTEAIPLSITAAVKALMVALVATMAAAVAAVTAVVLVALVALVLLVLSGVQIALSHQQIQETFKCGSTLKLATLCARILMSVCCGRIGRVRA